MNAKQTRTLITLGLVVALMLYLLADIVGLFNMEEYYPSLKRYRADRNYCSGRGACHYMGRN
jgi:hypothetical protein